jgi:hypothetical protein
MQAKAPALVVGLALIAVSAGYPAHAGVVDTVFGNTVISTYPDGRSQKIYMRPDGSWAGLSRRGNPLAGSWKLKNDAVCLKQSQPPTLPVAFCLPFPAEPRIGATWISKDLTGTPISLKIVKGKVSTHKP